MSKLIASLPLLIAAVAVSQAHAQPSVAERKAVMAAQIELLTQEEQLNAALARSAGNTVSSLPKVVAVMGMENKLVARLQMSTGAVTNYTEGQTVRPGMSVASITPRQVTLAVGTGKNSKAVPLEFIAGAQVTGLPGGVPPLPGGPLPINPSLLPVPPAIRLAPDAGAAVAAAAAKAPAQPQASAPQPAPAQVTPAAK